MKKLNEQNLSPDIKKQFLNGLKFSGLIVLLVVVVLYLIFVIANYEEWPILIFGYPFAFLFFFTLAFAPSALFGFLPPIINIYFKFLAKYKKILMTSILLIVGIFLVYNFAPERQIIDSENCYTKPIDVCTKIIKVYGEVGPIKFYKYSFCDGACLIGL